MSEEKFKNKLLSIVFLTVVSMNLPLSYSNLMTLILNLQPVTTTRIYVLHKITIALKLMSNITSDLLILEKKLQIPGYLQYTQWDQQPGNG